ncbi:MAG: ABC transporter substrate-binding protein [bacterium]|nr:ABC transporter substrate-binding protein [bacterium]
MRRRRLILVIALAVLIAAGCGNDDGGDVGQPVDPAPTAEPVQTAAPAQTAEPAPTAEPVQTAAPAQTAEPVDPASADFNLVIGQVMPETGSLAFLNSPMIEGIGLAIEDIQAAGGNVRLLTGDTATDPDVAPEAVNRLLGEGAHVIVGAAASGVSQSFIQTLYDAQIPQCSPSNTSPSFSTQDNAAFYFRTVPPDQAVAPILANIVAADGATNVAIPARADDWGNALSSLLAKSLTELGVAYQIISYDEDATSYDATVATIEDMGADAVVLVTFSEGAQIIRGMLEAGIPPGVMYGTDGIYDRNLADTVDPSNPYVLDGFVALTAGGGDEFSGRLIERTGGDVAYGGQAYDCVVVLALAALAAGSTDGPAIIGQVQSVTRSGQKCFSYAECAGLIAEGTDIDFDGVSGPLELDDVGDPTFGRYIIAEFVDGELTVTGSQDVDLAELG